MKTLILVLLMLGSTSVMAASYNCTFDNDGEDGQISLNISGSSAELTLTYDGNKKEYKKCKVSKDDFGRLSDCSELDQDLMVLVNEESGGIMSSTLDLYVDLEC